VQFVSVTVPPKLLKMPLSELPLSVQSVSVSVPLLKMPPP